MKKMKILLIGMTTNIGGIETLLYNIATNLDKTKFEIYFLDMTAKKIAFYNELVEKNIEVIKVTSRRENFLKHVIDLKQVFKNYKFDVIHFNIMDFSLFEPLYLANKYSKAQLILHSHNGGGSNRVSLKYKVLNTIGRTVVKKINYERIACGEQAGNWMFGNKPFTILNNAIDIEKFSFSQSYRNEIRNELDIDEKCYVIGQVAKLEEQKNPLFLLEIFNEYQKNNPNSKLLIVGEGNLLNEVKKRADDYKIGDKVLLVGKKMDAFKYYSAFDILVMPSIYEGLSITMVEAQVNGLKCITSDNVDKNSNLTGNVKFISLEKTANEWSEEIVQLEKIRDDKIIDKIPREYKSSYLYEKLEGIYQNISILGEC